MEASASHSWTCFKVATYNTIVIMRLAFSLILCYHEIKLSPYAAGRTIGVLYRPAVENVNH